MFETRTTIVPKKPPHNDNKDDYKIKVAQGFSKEDAGKISLVGKLAEHSDGSSSKGITKINRITKVHGKCQTINDNENPLAQILP